MSNATDRRFEAIKAVSERTVSTVKGESGFYNEFTGTRESIAADIRSIAKLGRTERWTAQVEGWATMVEDESNPLEWAFLQGSVWASHAAD